jgi:hypothetical protein
MTRRRHEADPGGMDIMDAKIIRLKLKTGAKAAKTPDRGQTHSLPEIGERGYWFLGV